MPWKVSSPMSIREEFLSLAGVEGANVKQLCARFGVSRKTAYKWIGRYRAGGREALADRSRRPRSSPNQTSPEMSELVLALRRAHPAWGARKLKRRLEDQGYQGVPSASTITEVLRRGGLLLAPSAEDSSKSLTRFEHEAPNDLWQMDFKGHFALTRGGRCHPLTVLDDHSRYAIGLRACRDEQHHTVKDELTGLFRVYGLPWRMLMDNGAPWGDAEDQPYTKLSVWLLRLGVRVSHGRAAHPQTQGKDERFHRTLKAEVLRERSFRDVRECQRTFDPWRETYNRDRPHEALGLAVPASRYRVSGRPFPECLPAVEYGPGVIVRKAQQGDGRLKFAGREVRMGKAFCGEWLGFHATNRDGVFGVYYCEQCLGEVDLKAEGSGQRGILKIERREKHRVSKPESRSQVLS
jgi:transposase InsO family protein